MKRNTKGIEKKGVKSKKYWIWILSLAFVLCMIVIVILISRPRENNSSKIDLVAETVGIVNTLGKKEVDFYRPLVQKEQEEISGQKGDAANLREYASRIYAQFLIGEKLNLCGPYSFSGLKAEMEQENNRRKVMKENGEVIYGPEQYELSSYFHYRLAEIKEQSIDALSKDPDEKLVEESRSYLQQNQDQFALTQEIEYELTINGRTEQKLLIRDEMSTLSKTDPQLLDILYEGKEGDSFSYQFGDEQRAGRILSIKRQSPSFDEDRQSYIEAYVANVVYPQLIQKLAEGNPVDLAD